MDDQKKISETPKIIFFTIVQKLTSCYAYLWCNVIWCSAESCGGGAVFNTFFAHPEISDLTVAVSVQQDVVQLQISEISL